MAATLFQSVELINDQSPINQRLSVDKYDALILPTELRFIGEQIGFKLLDDMIAKQNTAPYNPPASPKFPPAYPEYETLFANYLLPLMGFCVSYAVDNDMLAVQTNQGLLSLTAQNAEPADLKIYEAQRREKYTNIQVLTNRVKRFICENIADYPLADKELIGCKCGCSENENNTLSKKTFIFGVI